MSAKKRPFNLSIKAQDNGRYEITIRGIIGEYVDWSTYTIKDTEEDVLNELKQIPEGSPIDVRVNSRGGDVGLGLGIYNALERRKEHVTTYNDGYAISAASIVMLAGSKRVSPAASIWMIHRAQGGVDGTGADMRTMADGMDVIDQMMANVYATVSGKKTKAEFLAMMDKTTWCDGEKAVELGLATDCVGELPAGDGEDITDAEKKVIASFEKTIPENLRARVLAKDPAARASLNGTAARTAAPTNQQQPTKKVIMNKIIAALVAAGFSLATDAQEDAVLPCVNSLVSSRTDLKAKLDGHETALKNRVTAKIEKAITDKLIKAERKDALIKAGLADEATLDFIDDIRAAAATAQPRVARGVKPAPRAEDDGGNDDGEVEIKNLQDQMNGEDVTASERGELAFKALEKRGLTTLFKKQSAVKN